MTRHQTARSWHDNLTRRLHATSTAILDLIDIGTDHRTPSPACPYCTTGYRCNHWPRCNHPHRDLQQATDRQDGNFQPTLRSPSGSRSTTSDPVTGQLLVWEVQVQAATTLLYRAVTAAAETAETLGLTPRDEDGDELPHPATPATRTDGPTVLDENGRPVVVGRTIIDLPPRSTGRPDCRRAVLDATAYIAAVIDQVTDRISTSDGDVADAVDDRAHTLEQAITTAWHRLTPKPPPPVDTPRPLRPRRPCACDWDGCIHDAGECNNRTPERTCSTCRHRKSEARKAAS